MMLINNKMKQFLCGEGYGSNSNRKELSLDYGKIDDNVRKKRYGKKKKEWETHNIGDEVVVELRRAKNFDSIKQELDGDRLGSVYFIQANVIILDKRENKSGREEYFAEIKELLQSKSKRYQIDMSKIDQSLVRGRIIKIQAQ